MKPSGHPNLSPAMSDIACVPPEAVTAAHDDLTAWMLKYGWLKSTGLSDARVREVCSAIVDRVFGNADLAIADLGRAKGPDHEHDVSLLGKRVRVTLDRPEGRPAVITEGILLGFSDYGEFEVLEDGAVHYCWPMLDVVEVVPDGSV